MIAAAAKDGTLWYAYVGNNPVNYIDPDGLLIRKANNGSVTFEEGDRLYSDALMAGYRNSQDLYENGVFISPGGQLVSMDQILVSSDSLATNPNVDLTGLTLASRDSLRIYLLRGHSNAPRHDYVLTSRLTDYSSTVGTREIDIIAAITPVLQQKLEEAGYFIVLDPQIDWPNSLTYDDKAILSSVKLKKVTRPPYPNNVFRLPRFHRFPSGSPRRFWSMIPCWEKSSQLLSYA
jgi:hypothetical protein